MPQPVRLRMHRARDRDLVGRLPQAEYLHIEADVHVQVVMARLEEVGITLGSKLVLFLLLEDAAERVLHRLPRHGRVEKKHARAEVRRRLGTRLCPPLKGK